MHDSLPYTQLPEYPRELSAAGVLVRLLDGLGFRFRWATEGLSPDEIRFRPAEASYSILELTSHIWSLMNWIIARLTADDARLAAPPEQLPFQSIRHGVLEMVVELRGKLAEITDENHALVKIDPRLIWHAINGPLADALTHVGQINAFRRLAGNPTPAANLFFGLPPAD